MVMVSLTSFPYFVSVCGVVLYLVSEKDGVGLVVVRDQAWAGLLLPRPLLLPVLDLLHPRHRRHVPHPPPHRAQQLGAN